MKIHQLIQGSPEWHAFRKERFTASDAAAMLGYSKYKKRDELIEEKATGITPEVTPEQQKRFDRGHETEALARTILENEMDEEFYPVTGTHDDQEVIAASLDGIDMMGTILFEHKDWNKTLVAYIEERKDLPNTHWPQLEQQLFVSGAQVVKFVVSDGTVDNRVIFEYYSKPERLQEVLQGWEQFAIDLANYKPKAPVVEVIAKPTTTLPSLSINLTGEVSATNLADYKEAALEVISNIKTELSTDQDFEDAKATVKFCEKAESELKNKKQQALEQTASIAELFGTIDELSEAIRQTRLKLSKSITAQDKAKRANLIADAAQKIQTHKAELDNQLNGLSVNPVDVDLAAAIKGKRNYASMESSLNDSVAKAKIGLNNNFKLIKDNLESYEAMVNDTLRHLFSDLQSIISNERDIFKSIITARIADFEKAQREEAQVQPVAEEAAPEELPSFTKQEAANDPSTIQNPNIQDLNTLVDLRHHFEQAIYPRCKSDIAAIAVDSARISVATAIDGLNAAINDLEKEVKDAS